MINKKHNIYIIIKKYIWIFLASMIFYYNYTDELFMKHIKSELVILFLGIFISLMYITKIEKDIEKQEKETIYWLKIRPLLINEFKSNAFMILVKFLECNPFLLKTGLQIAILSGRKTVNDITCSEIGTEFKVIAAQLVDSKFMENENQYSDILVIYYNNILLYLHDIQTNVLPVIFMHSESAENIDLFVNFNGYKMKLEDEINIYNNNLNNNILNAFSKFFNDLNDICINFKCEDS